jgi:hypothetical protein
LSILYSSPFDLILGDHIFAKVVAQNTYGSSLESVPGDGAAMVQPPDAPVDFANNPAITTATHIGLQWSRGLSDGGKDVIDHTVSYDQGINKFIVLDSGIVGTSYTT